MNNVVYLSSRILTLGVLVRSQEGEESKVVVEVVVEEGVEAEGVARVAMVLEEEEGEQNSAQD